MFVTVVPAASLKDKVLTEVFAKGNFSPYWSFTVTTTVVVSLIVLDNETAVLSNSMELAFLAATTFTASVVTTAPVFASLTRM